MPGFDGIGANEYIVDVTHPETVDFISAGDTPYVWELNIWYHTLNVGFRTRISGETDFPCIYDDNVGLARSYAKVDGPLTYRKWIDAVRAGRNYVSDGKSHLIDFSVNGVEAGTRESEVRLDKPGRVKVTMRAAAHLPLQPNESIRQLRYDEKPYWELERARIGSSREVPVEIVVNGTPVATQKLIADGTMQTLTFEVAIDRSSWIAARILPSSHTNPVFAIVERQADSGVATQRGMVPQRRQPVLDTEEHAHSGERTGGGEAGVRPRAAGVSTAASGEPVTGGSGLGTRGSGFDKLCALAGAALIAAFGGRMIEGAGGTQPLPAQRALVDYERQVQPILAKRCLECHSQDKRKGGLSLATYADALEGGRNGAVIRPGNSANSLMLHRLTGEVEPQMPKDEDALSDGEIAVLRSWIDQGARETPTSKPAPQPWEAPLALARPALPAAVWKNWSGPLDRFVAAYLSDRRAPEPTVISDAQFARRVYLDVWGLLPTPDELESFLADRSAGKREALVARLLDDNEKYAAHWISFWNDLLRNEDGVTYFSETAGRKSITDWLLSALQSNLPYDQFVTKLLNPTVPNDPDGFIVGVNWRGETSAAVTPWMQASQNSAQIFLGINLKCNACHDSFVSKWKLKDAYALAAYFSPDPKLQMFRCDVALERYAEPGFLFPELTRTPASSALTDRRAAAATTFTDPRMGRLPRTLVNRMWHRLFGRGIVANPDEMDGVPWSPQLLDWVASDFVEHRYDIKQLIKTVLTSRAYQMPAVAQDGGVARARVCLRRAGSPADDSGTVCATRSARSQASGTCTRPVEVRAGARRPVRRCHPCRRRSAATRANGGWPRAI